MDVSETDTCSLTKYIKCFCCNPIIYNVVPSTLLMTTNKILLLMCGWPSACLLTTLHIITNLAVLEYLRCSGYFQRANEITHKEVISIMFPLVVSDMLQILSAKANSFASFIILKQITIVLMAFAEQFILKKSLSMIVWISVMFLFIGSLFVTWSDPLFTPFGVFISLAASILNVVGQISVGEQLNAQKDISALQLRYETFIKGFYFILLLPFLEFLFDQDIFSLVWTYQYERAMIFLPLSLLLAPVVSISYFFVVKQSSPLSFQILGPLKLVGGLLISSFLFQEEITWKQNIGISIILFWLFIFEIYK